MLKKPLMIATMAAALGMAGISTQASAGDPVLGAIIGGGIGAAIGHNHGRDGGLVGGVLGAIVGSSLAVNSGGYYDGGYAPSYAYGPAYYGPAYYRPAPVVLYSSGPYYRGYHRAYDHGYYRVRDNRDWHGDHRR